MKEFLSQEGVSYQEKNVRDDQRAAQEMVKRSGQMGVPVTVLADQVIVGFNQSALKNAVSRLRQQNSAHSNTETDNAIKLGAQVGDASRILTQQGQAVRPGAILGAVKPDSLAARAGLREGDVITALDGQAITESASLAQALQSVATKKLERPGLTFWRNGVEMDTRLPLQF